jgi:hypothetical protein
LTGPAVIGGEHARNLNARPWAILSEASKRVTHA